MHFLRSEKVPLWYGGPSTIGTGKSCTSRVPFPNVGPGVGRTDAGKSELISSRKTGLASRVPADSPNQEPGIPPGDLQGLCRHGPWSSPGEQRGRERSPAGFHTIPFGCSGPSSVKRRMFTQGEPRVSEFGQEFTQVKAGVSDPDFSCNSRNPG